MPPFSGSRVEDLLLAAKTFVQNADDLSWFHFCAKRWATTYCPVMSFVAGDPRLSAGKLVISCSSIHCPLYEQRGVPGGCPMCQAISMQTQIYPLAHRLAVTIEFIPWLEGLMETP